MLLIHADSFSYEVREPAIKNPEEITEASKKGNLREVLVAFCTVEKEDEANEDQVANDAAESIAEVAAKVKPDSILIHPYAHLSSSLASRDAAVSTLVKLEGILRSRGFTAYRSPFGWYKKFEITCKGHPLSELSRSITTAVRRKKAPPIETTYTVMDLSGKLYEPENYPFKEGEKDFQALVEKEGLHRGLVGGEPHYLEYCKKFGISWEPFSDVGHMRYGPEGTLIFDLISDYSWHVAQSLGIAIYRVRGTNMFDLSVPAVKEHADLFGGRLYEVNLDDRNFVLRYAACHQQFAMVRDWTASYRNLPFGTFEVADSYRLEQSGELLLCFRVRKMHMPDLHIFCKDLRESMDISMKVHKVIHGEIRKLGREYVSIYNTTRSFFDSNREFFKNLTEVEGKSILLNFVPEGIYYWVVNVEYTIIDDLGRPREIGTFQIDVGNAKRFNIAYTGEDGAKKYPPIIHTALIGSVERYLFTILDCAVRIERSGGKPMLPVWLSPIQTRVIPVTRAHLDLAVAIADKVEGAGIRVDIDDRDETVEKRVRDAEVEWIPYVLVVGRKEAEGNRFQVRIREKNENVTMPLEELIKHVHSNTKGYPARSLPLPRLVSPRPKY